MNANILWCAFGALIIIGMMNDASSDSDQLAKDQKEYCEMVQTFKVTNGQQGWPDYRGIFRKVCK